MLFFPSSFFDSSSILNRFLSHDNLIVTTHLLGKPILTKLGTKHWELLPIIFCSNDNHGLTLTFFYSKFKFCNLGFYMDKCDNDGLFGDYCIM